MAIGPEDRALIDTWLREHGALYVLQYIPQSGGGPDAYLVSKSKDISDLLDCSPAETELLVFDLRPFRIRGVIDSAMIQRVRVEFLPGEWWQLVNPRYFPDKVMHFCTTNDVEEMITYIHEHVGCERWVGPIPRWDDEWLKANANRWMSIDKDKIRGQS
jgi:hypothetical protein